ncbi:hypothetical protein ABIA39_009027 [Nocardia sp. GAS34]|uniref:helix-turn-helix domain-containing protein n=1 Tax=unclassified Nocardia TaxID=2637762 RepID=UPI003D1D3CE1
MRSASTQAVAACQIASFAAEDTDNDPGPSVVFAEEVSSLALLADALDSSAPPPDVHLIEVAARIAPWVLRTLAEFTSHSSLRLAAAALFVHHSTLQDRLVTIEHELGWSVRTPEGRLRVQLALAVRRLLLHPAAAPPASPCFPAGYGPQEANTVID